MGGDQITVHLEQERERDRVGVSRVGPAVLKDEIPIVRLPAVAHDRAAGCLQVGAEVIRRFGNRKGRGRQRRTQQVDRIGQRLISGSAPRRASRTGTPERRGPDALEVDAETSE